MKPLKLFWFKFKQPTPVIINFGVGISAYNYCDAIALLQERMFGPNNVPLVEQYIEDVSLDNLEENHVLPDIGLINVRGIWFPQGYETPIPDNRKMVLKKFEENLSRLN